MAHLVTHPQTTQDHFRSEEPQRQEMKSRREMPPRELQMVTPEKPQRFPLKAVALIASLVAILGLSWASEGLFMTELLSVSAIVALAALVHWMGRPGNQNES